MVVETMLGLLDDPFFNRFNQTVRTTNNNYPPYNVIKSDEDSYRIEIAVAGFNKKNLDISVENSTLIIKGDSSEEDNKVENQLTLRSYTSSEINSKETKILLDLKYKDRISLLSHELFSCSLDIEGKLLGYRIIHKQNITSNLNNPIIHLNKKLTHSTLFGSIKLIRI